MSTLITMIFSELYRQGKPTDDSSIIKVLKHCDVEIYGSMDKALQQRESDQERAKKIIREAIENTRLENH